MATETYKWFRPDANLRAIYGGGAIQAFGDSREVDPKSCTHRYVSKQLSVPSSGTRYLWEVGTATDTFTWIRVPDIFYTAISSLLSDAESATVVSTIPTGWVRGSVISILQPHPLKFNLWVRGDSLKAGLGTTEGDTRGTWPAQLINSIAGEALRWLNTDYSEGTSDNYQLGNMSLGASSWANTVDQGTGGNEAVYPRREDLAFGQRTQTLPLFGRNIGFLYALGTNDLNYDGTVTGAAAWARAAARAAAFKAEFPNIKLGIETLYKRSELSALNNRINDYNVLVRANAAAAGFDKIFDSEALVPQVNIVTGNTADTTYYTDGTHITTVTHGLIAAAHKQDMIDWLNAA